MQTELIGSWRVETISPLGVDRYTLTVTPTMSASIGEMRGKMDFDDVKTNADLFEMTGKVETPTKSTIHMIGKVNGNEIFGKVSISQYCVVDFRGVRNE
jgi:hypothetical protein